MGSRRIGRTSFPRFLIPFLFVVGLGGGQVGAQEKFSDFADQVPQSHDQIFAIHNLAGHLKAMLANQALQKTLTEGKLADFIQNFPNAGSLNPQDGLDWLEENDQYFPRTIVVAGSDSIYQSFEELFHALFRATLVEQVMENGDRKSEKDIPEIEKELAEILSRFKFPDATIWIQWDQDVTVDSLVFNFLKTQLEQGLATTRLKFVAEGDQFKIDGTIGDVVDRESVPLFLELMGMTDESGAIAKALVEIEIHAVFEHRGDGVLISLGNIDRSSTDIKSINGFQDGAGQIAFSQWDFSRLHEGSERLNAALDKWLPRPSGRVLLEHDEEDFTSAIRSMTRQFQSLPRVGRIRVWRQSNQILARMHESGAPAADDLTDHPILKFLPSQSPAYGVDATRSFAEMVEGMVDSFEERLAKQALKQELMDRPDDRMVDAISDGYYRHFRAFRTEVYEKFAPLASKPTLILVDDQGKIDRLSIEIDSDWFPDPLVVNDAKFPRFLAVTKVKGQQEFHQRFSRLYETLIEGVFSATETVLGSDFQAFEPIDLGNEIRATRLRFDWIEDAQFAKFEIEGDFEPHFFFKEGHFVFSTSVELSRQVASSDHDGKSLLKDYQGKSVVRFGSVDGRTIGAAYASAVGIVLRPIEEAIPNGSQLSNILDGLAEVAAIMNHFKWITTQQGTERLTEFELDFQK